MQADSEDYEDYTVAELRKMASDRDIPIRDEDGRTLRKDELVEILRANDEPGRTMTIREGQETVGPPLFEPVAMEVNEPPTESAIAAQVPESPSPSAAPPSREPTESYVVTEDSPFIKDRVVHRLAKGTVVTNRSHNIAELKRQKVRMAPHAGRYAIKRDAYGNPILPREYGQPDDQRRALVGHRDGAHIVVGPEGEKEIIMPESPSLKPNIRGRVI